MTDLQQRDDRTLAPAERGGDTRMAAEMNRAAQEVQGALTIAKRFPRDEVAVLRKIEAVCSRKALAEEAFYTYPRGQQKVTGPSIRLAEVIFRAMGNMTCGVRELSRETGSSICEAFAWDLEGNSRVTKEFRVRHWRDTKQGGYALTDERDIYEMVANQGARRLRACILSLVPADIQAAAEDVCRKALTEGEKTPLAERVKKMVATFKREYNVTEQQLEVYLGHNMGAVDETELVRLRGVFTSLRDGMSSVQDTFPAPAPAAGSGGETTGEKLKDAVAKSRARRVKVQEEAAPHPAAPEPAAAQPSDAEASTPQPTATPTVEHFLDDLVDVVVPDIPNTDIDKIAKDAYLKLIYDDFNKAYNALPDEPQGLRRLWIDKAPDWSASKEIGLISRLKIHFFARAEKGGFKQDPI